MAVAAQAPGVRRGARLNTETEGRGTIEDDVVLGLEWK